MIVMDARVRREQDSEKSPNTKLGMRFAHQKNGCNNEWKYMLSRVDSRSTNNIFYLLFLNMLLNFVDGCERWLAKIQTFFINL